MILSADLVLVRQSRRGYPTQGFDEVFGDSVLRFSPKAKNIITFGRIQRKNMDKIFYVTQIVSRFTFRVALRTLTSESQGLLYGNCVSLVL